MEKVEICELIERKLGLNHLVTIRFGIANCFLSVIGLKFGLVRRQLCTRLQLYRVQCMQHVAVVLELHRPGAAPAEAWIFLFFCSEFAIRLHRVRCFHTLPTVLTGRVMGCPKKSLFPSPFLHLPHISTLAGSLIG